MSETAPDKALIEMQGVKVTALGDPSLVVLDEVTWTVQAGEFWVVAGLQHSGKTDLLMHAAGLTMPAVGDCHLLGLNTREFDETRIAERLRMGFAFSGGKLFNQLTVAENVALPLRYHRDLPDPETAKIVEQLLELLGLAQFASVTPGNLPPAWRQRASLARALALKPELLLLDNPNGGLISRHRVWLLEFLDRLWQGHPFFEGRKMTIVVTTDDLPMWRHPRRKFATVHENKFSLLGDWGGGAFGQNEAVKDLLFGQKETEEIKDPKAEVVEALDKPGPAGKQN